MWKNCPSHLPFIDGALLSCLWHLYWFLFSEATSGFSDDIKDSTNLLFREL
jgi:hypothetical protein